MSSKTIYETFNEELTEQMNEQFNSFYKSAEAGKAVRIFNKTKETWENLQDQYMNQSIEMAKKAKKQSHDLTDIFNGMSKTNENGDRIESAKKAWTKIMNNNRDMIDWLVTNNNKSLDILNNHMTTIFDEMTSYTTQKKSSKTATSQKK
tara:strand:- start:8602 stop:9048 length:447 start_codon:yes stop_codon:yes gene_type:complete